MLNCPQWMASLLAQTTNPAPPAAPHWGTTLVPLAMAVIVLLVTVEMIRRRKLREEYALLWVGASVALVIVAIFPGIIIWLQDKLHVNYLTIVVLGLFLFLAMIVMHFAIVISKQSDQIRQLAQKLALMEGKEQPKAPQETKDAASPRT